ncbi:NifU-like protein [Anaerofustis stercorihominis DSM 17244]|uniref:NifU-like protein n=3 Tax=Anaerofustis stercorihominis TaxID=214853 RepID=B1C6G9_9FIRM|nr:NifU-like protein [Anaerofustis stercorihominis DSM 17244]
MWLYYHGGSMMIEKIEKVLNEKVRPSLNSHGGDVVIKSYEDNILRIKLIGKCSGCPAARTTNEDLIKISVMEEIPEVKDVILIEEVSEELLDFAKKILKH